MIMNAQIPPIPESRAKQTPARLARKIGPLFGVPWEEAPGGWRSWCCDYSRLTLAEIMRGAPRPAKPAELRGFDERGVPDADLAQSTPIANATAARFGPDTKAAFVLTGANVLLQPVTDALCTALSSVPVDDPELLIGAFAYCLIEVFRSEPLLILAAIQAEGVQRALSAVRVPFQSHGVTTLASHEFGHEDAGHDPASAPMSLDLVARLSETLCTRLAPVEANDSAFDIASEQAQGGSAHDRLCRLVTAFALRTLLDASTSAADAAMRIADGPDGRRADLTLSTPNRIRRFAQGITPHVSARPSTSSDGAPGPIASIEERARTRRAPEAMHEKLDQLSACTPDVAKGAPLDRRAALTVYRGLLTAAVVFVPDSGEAARHRRALLVVRTADTVGDVFGAQAPEARLERLFALTELIYFPVGPGQDPRDPVLAAQRAAWIREAAPLADDLMAMVARGEFSGGYVIGRVDDLLVNVNQVRRRQHDDPVPELPGAQELTEMLAALWERFLALLASFFDTASDGYRSRMHNYSAFLLGPASTMEMREQGIALCHGTVLPVRRRAAQSNNRFGPLRLALQVAMRGHARLARDLMDDPDAAAEHLRTARALAEELLAGGEEVSLLRGQAGKQASAHVMMISLADCYLTSAEAAAPDERAEWIARAELYLDETAAFVEGAPAIRGDRVREFQRLRHRVDALLERADRV